MTRQTTRPIERMNLQDSFRAARELVRMLNGGMLTVDLPYQRGAVWTLGPADSTGQIMALGNPHPLHHRQRPAYFPVARGERENPWNQ